MPETANPNDELLLGFIDESVDSLQSLPGQIEAFQANAQDSGAINAVFRAVHSIKGNASFFGLAAIKRFAHALENKLDDVRNGKLSLSEELARLMVDGFDLLAGMLQQALDGKATDELGAAETALLDRVQAAANQAVAAAAASEDEILLDAIALAEEMARSQLPQAQHWAERLRALVQPSTAEQSDAPPASPQAAAVLPVQFAGRPCVIGETDVTDRVTAVLEVFLAMQQRRYTSEMGAAFLRHTADFCQWAQSIGDSALCDALSDACRDFKTLYESPLGLDETLLAIVWEHLAPQFQRLFPLPQQTSATPQAVSAPDGPNGEKAKTPDKSPTEAAEKAGDDKSAGKGRLVRIKEEKLDEFLDDVSGLFITMERLKDLQTRMAETRECAEMAEELRQVNGSLNQQVNDLQGSVVALRMVPVRGLFQKFPRMARTLAGNLGKQIDVHLIGEELEIDKALAEDLDSPLTHMVRNVCDHGLEKPADRTARGLSETGNMWLKAELTRTHVIITVQDDGRGISPQKLRSKAVEKGVLTAAQAEALTDAEAVDLIFHPGFSTAEKVTEVSGRGVGMDVVRTKLREHDGDVKVESTVGVGTTFRLEIPIRQAVVVVDGLLIKHGPETFVLPFDNIREICEVPRSDITSVHNRRVARVRGTPYSAVSLHELLGLAPFPVDQYSVVPGVLVGCKHGEAFLLAEKIVGQRKVVVNTIDKILPGYTKIAGAAQLGGGKMALVLSTVDLIKSLKSPGRTGRDAVSAVTAS